MIGFIVGLIIGAHFGIFIAALLRADDTTDKTKGEQVIPWQAISHTTNRRP